MKNVILFIIGMSISLLTIAHAKVESVNTDAQPVVGYGYYNNGTTNLLVALNVAVDGTLYLH